VRRWFSALEQSAHSRLLIIRTILKQLGVVAERSEVAVFVVRHHTRMIANQDGSVYSTRCSAAYAVYREDQWRRRSKHTELES
jgi:hypothetical protein